LGVGTAAPGAKFSVLKNDHTTYTDFSELARFENSTTDYPSYKHGLSIFSTGEAAGIRLGSNVLATTTPDVTKDYSSRSSGIIGILNTASDGSVFNFLTAPVGTNTLTSRMYISSNGNVGIGTTAPVAKLAINTGASAQVFIGQHPTSTTFNAISLNGNLTDAGNVGLFGGDAGNDLYAQAVGNMYFRTGGNTIRMCIGSTGNVGIGTTAPGAPLEVHVPQGGADVTAGGIILSRYNNAGSYRGGAIYSRYITNGDALVFAVSNSTNPYSDFGNARMVIKDNGNVGIGTTTPSFKLHVPSGYIGTDYINTTDNSVTSGVTGVMVKTKWRQLPQNCHFRSIGNIFRWQLD
jgi:hypothetical protein